MESVWIRFSPYESIIGTLLCSGKRLNGLRMCPYRYDNCSMQPFDLVSRFLSLCPSVPCTCRSCPSTVHALVSSLSLLSSFPWFQVVGLRNPTYAGTRHNVGEMFLDFVAASAMTGGGGQQPWGDQQSTKLTLTATPLRAGAVQLHLPSSTPPPSTPSSSTHLPPPVSVTFLKPNVFMNESGVAIKPACRRLGVPASSLCVIHDGTLFSCFQFVSLSLSLSLSSSYFSFQLVS